MSLEACAQQSEALARCVEGLCETRPGIPLRELVELALAAPERSDLVAHVVRTTTTRVAVVWVDQRKRPADELLQLLTPRERQVALLVAEGARNREIASGLSISEATVKDHVHRTLAKLGCESRTDLVRLLLQST